MIITDAHVAATLRLAASVLDVQDWHTGDYSTDLCDPHGKPCCALGAIAVAAALPPTAWEEDPQDIDATLAHRVMERAATALGVYVGVVGPGEVLTEPELAEVIGEWNDRQPAIDTVMRALRGTADDLEVAA